MMSFIYTSFVGEGQVKNVESIFSAKVPIVKFSDQGTGVECDLSVENKDGILNSQIVRIISQIDGRFQKLCLLVKHWAKAHEVNSALHRTLNSVSITLLVALHLQTQNPPILPPFSMLLKDGMDPPNVEKRAQKFLNWGQRNQESLGRLFATFFIKVLYRFTFKPKHRLQNKLQYMLLYNELAFLSCSYNL
jgi:DNA polymerase sigma